MIFSEPALTWSARSERLARACVNGTMSLVEKAMECFHRTLQNSVQSITRTLEKPAAKDCWNENYMGAPADGKASETGDCLRRVARGGSWYLTPVNARVAFRFGLEPADRINYLGFRLARTL